ncbi:T3SS effector HopA1 family protein [Streptomyces sp. NRRL F-5650]|uniref:T3SS effector HopA1 family protein n=1 Tax=Streptomyces sp. NRRL F-5650 TaxID=1463868 RepID=UPI000691189A|nr:T3SS effector HopA1 family protein [Streptomyces sp. NRRL F-5650]
MTTSLKDAPATVDGLNGRVAEALTRIRVAPDCLSADVDGREITADTPVRLRDRLSVALYDHLHAGRPHNDAPMPRSLRDRALESLLHEATPHPTTPCRGRLHGVVEGSPVVEIDGVRVRIPAAEADAAVQDQDGAPAAASLLEAAERSARSAEAVYAQVRIASARPALSPGFFLVDGSRGRPSRGSVLRLYVHVVAATYAPGVWRAVLTALEAAGVPYRAKISSSPLLYPRRDALVVYLGEEALHAVDTVGAAVDGLAGIGAETSPFADRITAGFAAAWEPDDDRPGRRTMSFGQHRAAAVAAGLTSHRTAPRHRSAAAAVAAAFAEAGVDPAHPARSLGRPHADSRKED